ncbi:MAG TPA: family 1 glycosylhydrolase [Caldimonas sp.]|jgi:beta-glucosidase|nr:family 1 glycosylhydrolase [Caldimonas sp.]
MTVSLQSLQRSPERLTRADDHPATHKPTYVIATGIECSYPTVQGGKRRDELAETGHYTHWREDMELCREIGARFVRYGIPYYRSHAGPGRYDWEFADQTLPHLWDRGLIPIVDLCHFGVPDWVGGFQNTEWPAHFAEYCSAFAARYPWIKFYTPVNEMLVCARFSGKLGAWNEQEKSEAAFIRAHANQCRATLLAIDAILERRPDAVFIQSEVTEAYVQLAPEAKAKADLLNELRFLTFDHLYGQTPSGAVQRHLLENGLRDEELRWFIEHGKAAAPHCIMGMDYYGVNEVVVEADGSLESQGQMLGWHAIARDYYTRCLRPMMLTETNAIDLGHGESTRWLKQTWSQAHHLRHQGVPVIGFTWYSLTDQVDWDIQLVEIRGHVNANGLATLDRKLRDVGKLFKTIAGNNADAQLVQGVPTDLLVR